MQKNSKWTTAFEDGLHSEGCNLFLTTLTEFSYEIFWRPTRVNHFNTIVLYGDDIQTFTTAFCCDI